MPLDPDADSLGEVSTCDDPEYQRIDPEEFDSFDDVDSTTIVDDGAPA